MPFALQPFTNHEELTQLLTAFEHGALAPDDFHHREHLAVALWYCRQHAENEALSQMREALHRFLTKHNAMDAYSEPITQCWIQRVAAFVQGQPTDTDFLVAVNNLLCACAETVGPAN